MIGPRPVPIRCAVLIDAEEGVVRRALRRPDVWVRAATAVGAGLEIAGDPAVLREGTLLRFRPAAWRRPTLLRVADSSGEPVLESAAGPGRRHVRVRVMLTRTGAGTLATIEFVVSTALPLLNFALRPALVRYGEMLLGIAALAACEPMRVVAAALVENGRVLLARRKWSEAGRGRWELPGGKVEPGETDEQALRRELFEELSVPTNVFGRIGPPIAVEPGIELYCYRAEMASSDLIVLVDHDTCRWFGPDELDAVDLLESDRQLVESLRTMLQILS